MNTVQDRNEFSISVVELVTLLKRHIAMILAAGILGGVVTFLACTLFISPVYMAGAKMIVNSRSVQADTVTNDQITSSQKLVDTYAIIIGSQTVLNPVIDNLQLPLEYSTLQRMVTVSSVNNTQVMQISVESTDAEMALRVVQEILAICPEKIMDAMDAGSVKVIEEAYLQDRPVGPNTNLYVVMVTFLSMFAVVAVLVIRFIMDNTYKSDIELRNDLDLPVLGIIPDLSSCSKPDGSKK